LTTLAIIGAGIAGRSLIYSLAKGKKNFTKIIVFDSDEHAQTCSRRSTAIVAPRGVSAGHSDLGDVIVKGFGTFSDHVMSDQPAGVFKIQQYTGAYTKLDMFKKRYPEGREAFQFGPIHLKTKTYMSQEEAFLIDPELYLNWLKDESKNLPVEWRNDFITSINPYHGRTELTSLHGEKILVDKLVVTAGAYSRFWQSRLSGRPIQGSYFEFHDVDLGPVSFSLTLEGDNIVYHSHKKVMLLGSTTSDLIHVLPHHSELRSIYSRLQEKVHLPLPKWEAGKIITGLREKAPKRRPYLYQERNTFWLGGLYKNGYSLSLHLAKELEAQL
jgi:glycine/D-amino acid oxidase-like deaminating enzyme